jgi:polyisoprenoid-binding protein YceI
LYCRLSSQGLKSTIRFDEHDLTGSAVTASVDAKTVSTGFRADGELTLKGVTKPIQILFSFQTDGGNGGVFKGKFNINREDYNIGKHGGSIGDTVTIDLEVPVTK